MSKPPKPQIKSFLISDIIIQEKFTNKWSVIGIFDRIFASNFPCIQNKIGLYMRLADAEGEYNIRVEFCDSTGRKLAITEGLKLQVPSRLSAPDIGIQTYDLPIPRPDKYSFDLYFNEEFVQGVQLIVEERKMGI